MSSERARDELLNIIRRARKPWATNTEHRASQASQAEAILSSGYTKSILLGYVVVGRDGHMLGAQYPTKGEAQAMADEWTKDCKEAGVDWEYRVAEITEPAA